ncbi:MAG TPA: CNNM domain-containing protein [Phycisphaerae bacterium]|nr:CNNM domain-containing protein [Phycisphaerae bacterium]
MWVLFAIGILICVAASGLFSGAETGLYCVNRLRLRLARDRRELRALRLHRFLDDEQVALSVILVGTNLSNYLVTVFTAMLLGAALALSDRQIELYTTLLATPLIFVFGEVTPKNLFQRHADRLLYPCSLPLLIAKRVFAPLVWCIRLLSVALLGAIGWHEDDPGRSDRRRRMAMLLREGLANGEHAGQHLEFVDRVMDLPRRTVREVMVPRDQVVAVEADTDRPTFLSLARQHKHTRMPLLETRPKGTKQGVAGGGAGDGAGAVGIARVVGIVNVYSLLADTTWSRVAERAQPVEHVGPDTPVASVLLRLQRSAHPIAVVGTPQNPLLGIVTLEDLLEEIVGELTA